MAEKDKQGKESKHEEELPRFDDSIFERLKGDLSYDEEKAKQADEWLKKALEDAKKQK